MTSVLRITNEGREVFKIMSKVKEHVVQWRDKFTRIVQGALVPGIVQNKSLILLRTVYHLRSIYNQLVLNASNTFTTM